MVSIIAVAGAFMLVVLFFLALASIFDKWIDLELEKRKPTKEGLKKTID